MADWKCGNDYASSTHSESWWKSIDLCPFEKLFPKPNSQPNYLTRYRSDKKFQLYKISPSIHPSHSYWSTLLIVLRHAVSPSYLPLIVHSRSKHILRELYTYHILWPCQQSFSTASKRRNRRGSEWELYALRSLVSSIVVKRVPPAAVLLHSTTTGGKRKQSTCYVMRGRDFSQRQPTGQADRPCDCTVYCMTAPHDQLLLFPVPGTRTLAHPVMLFFPLRRSSVVEKLFFGKLSIFLSERRVPICFACIWIFDYR